MQDIEKNTTGKVQNYLDLFLSIKPKTADICTNTDYIGCFLSAKYSIIDRKGLNLLPYYYSLSLSLSLSARQRQNDMSTIPVKNVNLTHAIWCGIGIVGYASHIPVLNDNISSRRNNTVCGITDRI